MGQQASVFSSQQQTEYSTIFGEKYTDAVKYLSGNPFIYDTLLKNGINPNFALSIVFPEIIRYSTIQDKLETAGLLSLYVSYGNKYADFSIGRFQMKPSFVEQVERDYVNYVDKSYSFQIDTNDTRSRLARVSRLNSEAWQVKYLVMFIKVMNSRYAFLHWKSLNDKLKFYAVAYNAGYTSGEERITELIPENLFHLGVSRNNPKYNYADISLSYFTRY